MGLEGGMMGVGFASGDWFGWEVTQGIGFSVEGDVSLNRR